MVETEGLHTRERHETTVAGMDGKIGAELAHSEVGDVDVVDEGAVGAYADGLFLGAIVEGVVQTVFADTVGHIDIAVP